jgi:hypothetical protein
MATYYEAVAPREYTDKNTGEQKSTFTRIGVAFPFKEKEGFSIQLDAIPAPQEGVYKILLVPPRQKDNASQQGSKASYGEVSSGAAQYQDDDGDSIPF